jgi:hypothetical protein
MSASQARSRGARLDPRRPPPGNRGPAQPAAIALGGRQRPALPSPSSGTKSAPPSPRKSLSTVQVFGAAPEVAVPPPSSGPPRWRPPGPPSGVRVLVTPGRPCNGRDAQGRPDCAIHPQSTTASAAGRHPLPGARPLLRTRARPPRRTRPAGPGRKNRAGPPLPAGNPSLQFHGTPARKQPSRNWMPCCAAPSPSTPPCASSILPSWRKATAHPATDRLSGWGPAWPPGKHACGKPRASPDWPA